MCSWNFSKCRRIGIQNYKISLMSREQKANGVRDDDVARYLRGEKCADVVAKTRRKLARWQRLMISAGSLARFKSRPRLYPRVLPRICPSLFAASFTTPSHTGLSESHEPVNSSLALTNHVPHRYLIRFSYHPLNLLQPPHRENVRVKFLRFIGFCNRVIPRWFCQSNYETFWFSIIFDNILRTRYLLFLFVFN